MRIEVRREAPDGLSATIWEFDWRGRYLVLTELMEGSRPSTRHKFKGDKWSSMDERNYYSKLPRPKSIPDDVIAEAMSGLTLDVAIGWSNPDSVVAQRTLAGEEQSANE
jgi:hypothetical protein